MREGNGRKRGAWFVMKPIMVYVKDAAMQFRLYKNKYKHAIMDDSALELDLLSGIKTIQAPSTVPPAQSDMSLFQAA